MEQEDDGPPMAHPVGGMYCFRSDAVFAKAARELRETEEKLGMSDPLVLAAQRLEMARLLRKQGRRHEATAQVKASRETRVALLGKDAAPSIATAELLGHRFRAHEQQRSGCAVPNAVAHLAESAAAVAPHLLDPLDSAAADPLVAHAGVLAGVGDHTGAAACLQRAHGLLERVFGAQHARTVAAMLAVAEALQAEAMFSIADDDREHCYRSLLAALTLLRLVSHAEHAPVLRALKAFRSKWMRRANAVMHALHKPMGALAQKTLRVFDAELFAKAREHRVVC